MSLRKLICCTSEGKSKATHREKSYILFADPIVHRATKTTSLRGQPAMFILYINAYLPHAVGAPLSIWTLRKCADTERCVSESDSYTNTSSSHNRRRSKHTRASEQ
jgi:hypothetical protein